MWKKTVVKFISSLLYNIGSKPFNMFIYIYIKYYKFINLLIIFKNNIIYNYDIKLNNIILS